jgi:hypothetical protein
VRYKTFKRVPICVLSCEYKSFIGLCVLRSNLLQQMFGLSGSKFSFVGVRSWAPILAQRKSCICTNRTEPRLGSPINYRLHCVIVDNCTQRLILTESRSTLFVTYIQEWHLFYVNVSMPADILRYNHVQ